MQSRRQQLNNRMMDQSDDGGRLEVEDFQDTDVQGVFGGGGRARGGGLGQHDIMTSEQVDDFLLGNQDDEDDGGDGQIVEERRGGKPAAGGQGASALDFLADNGLKGGRKNGNIPLQKASGGGAMKEKEALKGKPMMGTVFKLGDWGIDLNERFLKLNKKGLSYYRAKPEEEYKSLDQIEAQNSDYKPKCCVPLDAIVQVDDITEEERKKYKKHFKTASDTDTPKPVFKVVFHEKMLKKKEDLVPDSHEASLAQISPSDLEMEPFVPAKNTMKDLKTWYFSLDPQQLGHTKLDWLLNISVLTKRTNKQFNFCPVVATTVKKLIHKVQVTSDMARASPRPVGAGQLGGMVPGQQSMEQEMPDDGDKLVNLNGAKSDDPRKAANQKRINKFMQDNYSESDEDGDEAGDDSPSRHADDYNTDGRGGAGGKNSRLVADTLQRWDNKVIDTKGQNMMQKQEKQIKSQMTQQEKLQTDKMVLGEAEKGLKKQDQMQKIEDAGWDLKFQRFTDYVINSQDEMSRNFELSQRLLDHVGKFRERARDEVTKIVDELDKPLLDRQSRDSRRVLHLNHPLKREEVPRMIYEAVPNFCDEDYDTKNTDLIFYEPDGHNMIIKLTYPADYIEYPLEEDDTSQVADKFDDAQTLNQRDLSQIKPEMGKRQVYKQFARELLAQDIIYDAILFNSSQGKTQKRLRVPLCAMVDYKGFRAIAYAFVDINTVKLELGFKQGNYIAPKKMETVYQDLRNIGIMLNLKENRHQTNSSQQQYKRTPISSFVKIFANTSGQEKNAQDEDEKNEAMKHFYDYHFKDLEYEKEPQYYVLRVSEIFPFDIDPADSNMDNFHRDKVLRPELVCANEKSLRVDTKKQSKDAQKKKKNGPTNRLNPTDKDNHEDNTDAVDLNLANKFLREMKIKQLVDLLDSLIIVPIDSGTLQEAFHIQGVNMRYLGNVAEQSKLKHVKDMCVTDMLARTLKRIFNTAISQLILFNCQRKETNMRRNKEVDNQIDRIDQADQPIKFDLHGAAYSKNQESAAAIKQQEARSYADLKAKKLELMAEQQELSKPIDVRINEWIIDFMNLIFGLGDETRQFWDEVLYPEVHVYYNYPLSELYKFEKNLNALYFALTEQLNLKVTEKPAFDESMDNAANAPGGSNELGVGGVRGGLGVSKGHGVGGNMLDVPFGGGYGGKSGGQVRSGQGNQKMQAQLDQKEDYAVYKDFGKNLEPFGTPTHTNFEFELVPKTRTYKFRNLMYNAIAQKFRDYKNCGQMSEAYETCKMRKHLAKCLRGQEDNELTTKLDLCQLQLEDRQWESAQRMASLAMEVLKSQQMRMHARAIQFQTILMQAHYMAGEFQVAEKAFTLALEILDHHWGPYHPLHINIYNIMAQLLILNQKYEDATYLYKASLRCCIRILGPNHIQTGEVHMDYARLQLLKSDKDRNTSKGLQQKNDSLQHFIEAFNIFKNYFESEKLDALQTAEAAKQIAELLEEDNRMEEAFKYARVASQTFQHVYAQDNPLIVKAMWQELSIAYAICSDETEELAAGLFYALAKRDYILSFADITAFERHETHLTANIDFNPNSKTDSSPKPPHDPTAQGRHTNPTLGEGNPAAASLGGGATAQTNAAVAQQLAHEKTSKEIDKIKAQLIATIIMEKTRTLKSEEKKHIKAFCDKQLFYEIYEQGGDFKEKKENIIANLESYHYTNLNPLRVASVRNLDIHDRANQLLTMYNQSVRKINWLVPEDGAELDKRKSLFHQRYLKMIKQVIEKEQDASRLKGNHHANVGDTANILLDRQGADDLSVRVVEDFNSDVDQNFFPAYDEGLDGSPRGVENPNDPNENENCRQFFRKLIKIFNNINFYNLLNHTAAQAGKDAEMAAAQEH